MGQSKREIINISDWSNDKKYNLLMDWDYGDYEDVYEFEQVNSEVINTDLEKGFEEYESILKRKSDGKFFRGRFYWSYDWNNIDEVQELTQVLKKSRMITYYE